MDSQIREALQQVKKEDAENPITQALKRVSFNVQNLTYIIFDTKEIYESFKLLNDLVSNDPITRNDFQDLGKGREELFKIYCQKAKQFHSLWHINQTRYIYHAFCEKLPALLHSKMFIPTIVNLASDKQIDKWLPQCESGEIIGCYAQSELGHGSDIQNLETTAVYDKKTQQFVINSPTITSSKWFIGDIGLVATHCVAHAQLLIDGKSYGIQSFIIPVRDKTTHLPLEGVLVGDMGPKLGFNVKDNGFVRFTNVRIPRDYMLQRYAKVNSNGVFVTPKNEKVGYATMMRIRLEISINCFETLGINAKIANRYAHIRKQFHDEQGKEVAIWDYQTQKAKIIPQIAQAYTMMFTQKKLADMVDENIRRIREKDDFSMMQDLHSILCGCKADFTWNTYFALDKLRQACGGLGYSEYGGIASYIREFSPNTTFEGENTVLLLQCARYLLKVYAKQSSPGHKLSETTQYFQDYQESLKQRCQISKVNQLFCPELVKKTLRYKAIYLVQQAAMHLMQAASENEVSQKEAWNKHAGIALTDAALAHTHLTAFTAFQERIVKIQDDSISTVLGKVCCLYGIQRVIEKPAPLFESGYMNGDKLNLFMEAYELLIDELADEAIGLTEAFAFDENTMRSVLIYTDPYKRIMELCKNNEVNKPEFRQQINNHLKKLVGTDFKKLQAKL